MIRRLVASDYEQVIRFLTPEREVNLFILGDIDSFGFDHPDIPLWGDFNSEGELRAVLLRYHDSLIFYTAGSDDRPAMLDLIRQQPFAWLAGKASVAGPMGSALGLPLYKELFFCRLDGARVGTVEGPIARVEVAGMDDIDGILELLRQIREFPRPASREEMVEKFSRRAGRAYVIRDEGRIVSVAQTTAECRFAGMVVGVATLPAYRQRGYASACVGRLCEALIAEGKGACLFYDNPAAGPIYKRIGFEDIDRWMMFRKEKKV